MAQKKVKRNPSAEKRARQSAQRQAIKKSSLSRTRGAVKKAEQAVASKDLTAARAAMQVVEPALARSARKGGISKNAAARKTSRLQRRINQLAKPS